MRSCELKKYKTHTCNKNTNIKKWQIEMLYNVFDNVRLYSCMIWMYFVKCYVPPKMWIFKSVNRIKLLNSLNKFAIKECLERKSTGEMIPNKNKTKKKSFRSFIISLNSIFSYLFIVYCESFVSFSHFNLMVWP